MFAESSKAFAFQKFAVKCYFGLSIHIFQHSSSLSLEYVCDSWCMHQTGFSLAAAVPQSLFTELCSSAAVVSQSKSTELFSSAGVVPQSKSTEMWSSEAPFHHDLWYFRHRIKEHFNSVIYYEKLINHSRVTDINTLHQITGKVMTPMSRTHIPFKALTRLVQSLNSDVAFVAGVKRGRGNSGARGLAP